MSARRHFIGTQLPIHHDSLGASTWRVLGSVAVVALVACGADTERTVPRADTSVPLTPSPAVAIAPSLALPAPDASRDTQYVGVHVPEEFGEMGAPMTQHMNSAYFRDSSAELALFHFALSGDREEVWLLEHLPRARPGDPTGWTVLAALAPPDTLNSGLRIWLECARRGKPNPRLIVVVRYEDQTTLTRIQRAWQVDSARRIVVVPTEGITCHNEIVVD